MRGLQFALRSRALGRLRLRPGLPNLSRAFDPQALAREREFYRRVLGAAQIARDSYDRVVDVGSRNGSYLAALADYFPRAEITGLELDGYRRHLNLYRRCDYGEAFALELRTQGRSAKYQVTDFRSFTDFRELNARTLITFFYPFVSPDPCRAWGLPVRYADFGALLEHALGTQAMLSVHQGEWELEIARAAYQTLGLNPREHRLLPVEFKGLWPSPYPAEILFSEPGSPRCDIPESGPG